MEKVLFVCSGNTCRSPMAEAIFNSLIEKRPLLKGKMRAVSAGTYAGDGEPMHQNAREALDGLGIVAGLHKSALLTPELARDATIILAMERSHLGAITAIAPDIAARAHTLKEYAGVGDGGISDPYCMPLKVYADCANELKNCIELLLDRMETRFAEVSRQTESKAGAIDNESDIAVLVSGNEKRIAVGCDHAAFERKHELLKCLVEWGYDVVDCGAYSTDAVDYPDIAELVCRRVTSGDCARGLLICGTGIGMCIAANKMPGIRCSLCAESYSARLTREHNDSNVLSMGARTLGAELAKDVLRAWLGADYPAEERNVRRLNKIAWIEKNYKGS